MKSIISLHIGAAGIRVGTELWPLLDTELGSDCQSRAFREDSKGGKLPNAVFADTEEEMKREVLSSAVLGKAAFVSSKYGLGGLPAPLQCAEGRDIRDVSFEAVRKVAEGCESVDGLVLIYSLSGGTGSGLTKSLVTSTEINTFGSVVSLLIMPDGSSVIEPYNFVLGINPVYEKSDVVLIYDNARVGKVAESIGLTGSLTGVNTVIAQTASHLFTQKADNGASLRRLASRDDQFKFVVPSVSLNLPADFSAESDSVALTESLSKGSCYCFTPGSVVSTYTQFRGDWTRLSAENYLESSSLRKDYDLYPEPRPRWSAWREQRYSALTISRSKSVSRTLKMIRKNFNRMASKNSYMFWYLGVGISTDELYQGRNDLETLTHRIIEN